MVRRFVVALCAAVDSVAAGLADYRHQEAEADAFSLLGEGSALGSLDAAS